MPEFTANWFEGNERPGIWKTVFRHLCGRPQLKFLEVGSYEGRSALWILSQMTSHPTAHLTCLDAWKGGFNSDHNEAKMRVIEARFDDNLAPFQDRFTKIKADSAPGMARLLAEGEKFDVVYVDACHRPAQATADIILAYHLLAPRGYLVIDDYSSQNENHVGLMAACDTWLEEFDKSVTVVHRDYQLIVRKGLPRMDPVFYCQVYRDPELLDECLKHFRASYPDARCYIISDGDDVSPWEEITARWECEYYAHPREKLLKYGGRMLQRNLSYFCDAPGTHLIKFDTDSRFHRPFHDLPGDIGMYGSVQFSEVVRGRPRRRSIQGGCYIWTARAVYDLLNSKVLLNPCWANPDSWGGDVGPTKEYVERTGLISEDWLLGEACPLVGVPMEEFDEVMCVWKGEVDTGPDGLQYAVTHPHKDLPENAK